MSGHGADHGHDKHDDHGHGADAHAADSHGGDAHAHADHGHAEAHVDNGHVEAHAVDGHAVAKVHTNDAEVDELEKEFLAMMQRVGNNINALRSRLYKTLLVTPVIGMAIKWFTGIFKEKAKKAVAHADDHGHAHAAAHAH